MKGLVITGTGACIPDLVQQNEDFISRQFYDEQSVPFQTDPQEIVKKFKDITGIAERRYLSSDINTSDLGTLAAKKAIADSEINPEDIDLIIVAHNFGNVWSETNQSDAVPSIANRIKKDLGIQNPNCVAFDLLFGCPGWVQSLIVANALSMAGNTKKCLIIGTETLSRVVDQFDRDSMIFSDGAGAVIMETRDIQAGGPGILSSSAQSYSNEELEYINMGASYEPNNNKEVRYIKMQGRKVYEFALSNVPLAMKDCLDKSGVDIKDLKKIFIHQANEKMDEAILKRFYRLYNISDAPKGIMPMSIHWLGNSSVATVPTLFDLVKKGMMPEHQVNSGDVILFASVGAGMNINAVCYRC